MATIGCGAEAGQRRRADAVSIRDPPNRAPKGIQVRPESSRAILHSLIEAGFHARSGSQPASNRMSSFEAPFSFLT